MTHKDIISYFMTITEASQLVIQAGGMAKGGELFILNMGDPVRIYDLAEDLIRLSGLKPHEDIEIKVTGLRPGEKLYEELLMAEEGMASTAHEKIHIGAPYDINFKILKSNLEKLLDYIPEASNDEIKDRLTVLVPTYKSMDNFRITPFNSNEGKSVSMIRKPIVESSPVFASENSV